MSKAVNYNIPYGEDYWILTYSGTDYYRSSGQLWNIYPKFICETNIERAVCTGRLSSVKLTKYRAFELILKDPTQSQYDFYKGLEGLDVTVTPHSDESFTYDCIVKLVEIKTVNNKYKDRILSIMVTQDEEL